MKQENPLSMLQMTEVMDNAPFAVYVSALSNYELLYANEAARALVLQKSADLGIPCYQAAGLEKPCPFCRVNQLNRSSLLVREFCHPVGGRIYQLSGKIIDWDGQPAHIEYIVDITNKKREEQKSQALKEKLEDAFSNVPCGLCVYRYSGGRIIPLFHNPAFYTLMGYSEQHIQSVESTTNYLGVHPDDIAPLQEKVAQAIGSTNVLQYTYRVWNDKEKRYRWLHLEGSVKTQEDGTKLMYGVYNNVSKQVELEEKLTDTNRKMQDVVSAIPGGIAIYKLSTIFETKYFSDGVAGLTGYTAEEYQAIIQQDASDIIYQEDRDKVMAQAEEAVKSHDTAVLEFRVLHRDGHIVWVRVQTKWIGEEDGCPLLQCVFHNISDLKEAQLEMNHLVNSIPGGIASYKVQGGKFVPLYYSDGVMALSGHTRQEFEVLLQGDALNTVCEMDRPRVRAAVKTALKSGNTLDISYRMRHKNGNLIWIHLNGRRMGPEAENPKFYAVYTGMSAETRLFQSIANETADGIYVIDKENYDLLYTNESKNMFMNGQDHVGQKCYKVLHGKDKPCSFCTLHTHAPDGTEHEMQVEDTGHYYSTRFRETVWNGLPAYVKYMRDTTEDVKNRREKERLEQYFESVVNNLPGGIGVVRYEKDGSLVPEYISEGFAAMTGMTLEDAWETYRLDAMTGVHPQDQAYFKEQMQQYLASGAPHCEIVYRLKKGDGSYVWVKNTLSIIKNEGGESRIYAVYQDMTAEREKQARLQRQYNNLIMQHYRDPDPNALIVGHCNVSQNRIIEIEDYTNSDLLKKFSTDRQAFFTGISTMIVDSKERKAFLGRYLNEPALAAFKRKDTEQILECFIKIPNEKQGRYVRFKMNLVSAPDSGEVTGILTVADITEHVISERILQRLAVVSFDLVVDVDLTKNYYRPLRSKAYDGLSEKPVLYSDRVDYLVNKQVVLKDRERLARMLEPAYILERLKRDGSFSFPYATIGEKGNIRTKNLTISAIDLRLGRICLARTDITASVREQQGLLNMMAYTFELMGFIDVSSGQFIMHTRQTVLENLPPYTVDQYNSSIKDLVAYYNVEENREDVENQFQLETILKRLDEKPTGYDFVFPCVTNEGNRYKQVNVLWGDTNHKTVCLVRADVTDMLSAERRTKKVLEKALNFAEEASRAKSDFLSAMSHDIRTPLNAIMGMTALATAHLDEREKVSDYLHKVSISSKHLLSLVNDILDMSKIENSKITLNRMRVTMPEMLEQLSAIIAPQAKSAGLQFQITTSGVVHEYFYGDALRLNQILINILSNAVKFTPEGGQVNCLVEEIPGSLDNGRVEYGFTIRDTGIGMSEEFQKHLFAPFMRSNSASRIEGTGLGLSITKGLVDLMNGSISVESEPNKGTTFRLKLPFELAELEDASPYMPEEKAVSSQDGKADKIFDGCLFLIAEDNPINAEILCELLAMFGAKSVVKTDGGQAVKAFKTAKEGTFDAILMDIQMPEMNGYEATRLIRAMERPDAANIPIVAMTANAFAEDVQASREAGMNAHIAKPIDIGVLRATLHQILIKGNSGL